jgi:hypothetical protein
VVTLFLACACVLLAPPVSATAATPAPAATTVVVQGLGIPHIGGLDPCDLTLNPIVKKGCETVAGNTHIQVPVIPTPENIAGSIANAVVPNIVDQFTNLAAGWVAGGLQHLMKWIVTGTVPNVTQEWALRMGAFALGFAIYFVIICFDLRMTEAARNREPVEMARALFSLAIFLALAPTLPFVVNWMVQRCDNDVAPGLLDQFGGDMQKSIAQLLQALESQGNFSGAAGATILIAIFGVIGSAVLLIEIFFRNAALYVFTFYSIVAFALWVRGKWGVDRFRRAIVTLVVLSLFKVIAAFIMVIGVLLLGDPSQDSESVIYGAVVLLMVPWGTWEVYKRSTGHRTSLASMYYKSRAVYSGATSLFGSRD